MDKLLDVKNLNIEFATYAGAVHAIRGVDFYLEKGETLAIVGESGSGKSVTTRSVMGLLANNATITDGTIEFKGENLLAKPAKDMQKIRGREMSMIFQDPMTSLNPTMTIGKQVAEPLRIHQGLSKKAALAKALEMLELVGIPNAAARLKDFPHQFSGGQRQRIVIAIALICEPDILISDEPTTALDVTVQAQIIELMKDIQKETASAIIFITHDLGVVANVADRVAVMYGGRIVETGTVDEVFYHPQHPYTWGLLSSMPSLDASESALYAIPGTPPDLLNPPTGDAFYPRNEFALEIDRKEAPPMFEVAPTHHAATWLLAPEAPTIEPPEAIKARWAYYQKKYPQEVL